MTAANTFKVFLFSYFLTTISINYFKFLSIYYRINLIKAERIGFMTACPIVMCFLSLFPIGYFPLLTGPPSLVPFHRPFEPRAAGREKEGNSRGGSGGPARKQRLVFFLRGRILFLGLLRLAACQFSAEFLHLQTSQKNSKDYIIITFLKSC